MAGVDIGDPVVRLRCSRRVMVDPGPVIAHVDSLRELGMTAYMIHRAAGTNARAIDSLRQYKTVSKTTADALLAVTPRPVRQQAEVLAFGARRRIEALYFAGHTRKAIAGAMGKHPEFVTAVCSQRCIRWGTHVAIDGVFRKLMWKTGGSARTSRRARRQGFLPALAWDDIDDYFEVPDKSVLWRPGTGKRGNRGRGDARLALVAEKDAQGLTAEQIAQDLGVSQRQVVRDRARLREAS